MADATTEQLDAFASLQALLESYGLGELSDWAWEQIIEGSTASQVGLSIYDQPLFRDRFRSIFERQAAGLPPMSVEEVLAYEAQASALATAMGLPAGFMTRDVMADLMSKDISIVELESRAQMFVAAAFQMPAEVRDQLKTLYGIDEGGIAAYFMDEQRGLQLLQSQFTASQLAGSAQRQGYSQLTQQEAEGLIGLLDPSQADAAFGALTTGQELFGALPGAAETAIDRATQLAFATGQEAATKVVEKRSREREGIFQAGGGFAASQEGLTGVGLAST